MLDLRAAPLERRTLRGRALLDQYGDEWNLETDYEVIGGDDPCWRASKLAVPHGLEALINTSVTRGRRMSASILPPCDQIELIIEDDGQGFDTEALTSRQPGRFGLVGLNERARLLGGALEVCSVPGEGTELKITVPLEAAL
ncbi:MAG: hypothetical protein LC121_25095 [Anaerolineae bacterium]|nr:hypothetical protein [Anaerolineae bacterium]